MDCLETSLIQRYVQGTLEDWEADEVTRHLVSCKKCRQAVADIRGSTDPKAGAVTEQFDRQAPPAPKKPQAKPSLVKVKCQKCNARYGIPEDRVRGRMLKIRCKNCQSIIEVWSSEGSIRSVIDRGKKVWFLVVKRQRIGPMTEQEVRERHERGEVKSKTYAWRQGFSKWERLIDITEFRDLPKQLDRSISAQPTRKGPMPGQDDLDPTAKARPPRSYLREPSVSEDLDFDAPRSEESLVDSMARTAYLPENEDDDDGAATGYHHKEEETPQIDAQLTHVHMSGRSADPLDGLSEAEGPVGDEHQLTSRFDEDTGEVDETWNRDLASAEQFDESDAESAPPDPRLHTGDWEQRMKGQRHDNSVLFSLGHLKNLAAPERPSRQASEDKSLFDIRPTAGAAASALLMPSEPERSRRGAGLFVVVALLGVVIGAAVLLGILYLVQPKMVLALLKGDEVEQSEKPKSSKMLASVAKTNSPATTPISPDASGAAKDAGAPDTETRAPVGDSADPAGKTEPPPTATEKSARKKKKKKKRKKRRKKRRKKGDDIEVVDPDEGDALEKEVDGLDAPDPATPAPAPPSKKKGGNELDKLIDGATGPGEVKKAAPAKDDPPGEKLPSTLNRQQVAAGMKRANPGVRACYQQHQQPGMVTVSATVNGSTGTVIQARALGGFAGTPSGACVVQAVRRLARFARFSGPALTLKYPYMLR